MSKSQQEVLASLSPCTGVELGLDQHNQLLRRVAQDLRPSVVGALRLTCSDESERECIDSFQRHFVQPLLPNLKFWTKSPFRLANLGGRYQEGAVAIAEDHFALPDSRAKFKVMLVRVNSHVAVDVQGGRYQYGRLDRYQVESVFCGALHALLDGSSLAFAQELRTDFSQDGVDRLALIRKQAARDPGCEGLVAAIVNCRLQAARVVADIQVLTPKTPTLFLVVANVTLNRLEYDTELQCGVYLVDATGDSSDTVFQGLPDRPPYQIDHRFGHLRVTPGD